MPCLLSASLPPSLKRKALPALLLGCCVAQPLFAQTAAPAAPPERPRNRAPSPASGSGAPAPGTLPTAAPAQTTADATAAGTRSGTADPEPQAGAADDMATVEVVASRPTNKVDRDVYDLKNDISVSNASAADILNNVPSVSVDQDGTVALRGNQNVQIMVNGKRDAQFQGQNRGDALNAFPAENIESIEVINVPGAEFGNEGGSGPIINLVLKRNRKPGSRASLSANKGTEDRYNGFLNGEYAAGPYSISGNLGVRKALRSGHSESQREDLDPQTGSAIGATNSASERRSPSTSVNFASTLTYNVGERDQAGATLSFSKTQNDSESTGSTRRFGPGMLPAADYSTRSTSSSPAQNFGLGASYVHKSGEPGEELKFDLRYTGQTNDADADVFYDYRLAPLRYATDNRRTTDRRNRIVDLSLDYQRTVWSTWLLKAGAKVADSRNANGTDYLAVNPASGNYEPVASRISDFRSDDRNAAVYGILSTRFFKDLQVQAGIRGEYTELKIRQPLLAEEDHYTYLNWLPSFYATQGLGEHGGELQLRASRRIARPNERDLNPNLVYLSDFYARQGNPNLEPVDNDSYELAYRDNFFSVDTSVTLYKRRESPVIGNRSTLLASDPNVIVTTPINFGANDSTGIELNVNARRLFVQGLSANLGTTIGNETRMRLFNFSDNVSVEQKNHRENVRLRLAYQFDAESLQLSVNRNGQSLNGQGVNGATTMTNFTWQHRFSPRLSLNLNVNNVFGAGNTDSYVENEVLRLHSLSTTQARIFTLGLRYQWGGVTGDERIRNGGRGMFRGGPGGRNGGGGGFGNGSGGGNSGGGGGFGG
ncbi:TonB-dependent receptor [Massilia forsythiae]|uniref:TonB-dependent receptor n=1 Tax=Massilia forsythiae TaxID=2728020 RepID=A0A7Z2VTU9_9BURK|nr:TonB-dependent receptor [Massilia forsythiae]QJD98979.1 TonB-dependent receptor [Massilia forsythiae]